MVRECSLNKVISICTHLVFHFNNPNCCAQLSQLFAILFCRMSNTRPFESSAAGELRWFSGPTERGVLSLGLPRAPDSGADVLSQVLALGEVEPLIATVEAWLEVAWDPAPTSEPQMGAQGFEVRQSSLAPPGTRLLFEASLNDAPAPPDTLRSPDVAWTLHEASVCLGQVPLSARAELAEGALVWIPPSFLRPWLGQLSGQGGVCQVEVDLSSGRLQASESSEADETDALTIRLQHMLRVPLDVLLGWPRAEPWQHALQPHALSLCLQQGSQRLAHGQVLPLGQGHAMRISVMGDGATEAVPAEQ